MWSARRIICLSGLLAGFMAVGVGCGGRSDQNREHAVASDSDSTEGSGEEKAIPVKTIRPKLNPNFVRSVTQPTDLKSFYRADLMARVPGVVTEDLKKNIGDMVKKDEILLKLDAP